MSSYPFVNFLQTPTQNISSTPVLVFGSDTSTCILDGFVISNMVNNKTLVSVFLLREEGTPTPTESVQYMLFQSIPLEALSSFDWLKDKSFIMEAGDTLWAYSDYDTNIFNTFISYRELTELTAPLSRKIVTQS